MALGRSRRSVLVLDAGSPRNAAAGHVHNYLGREGTPRWNCWRSAVARWRSTACRSPSPASRPSAVGICRASASSSPPIVAARSWPAGCWPPPASPTYCPTCPVWPTGGGATCCTVRTATAGRSVTERSPCWPPTPWPRTRRCSSDSSPTTWSSCSPRALRDRPRTISSGWSSVVSG
ncbi:MAG: hypothetical protein WKF73_08555 [Nocardioidaceae bacterium]